LSAEKEPAEEDNGRCGGSAQLGHGRGRGRYMMRCTACNLNLHVSLGQIISTSVCTFACWWHFSSFEY